MRRLFRLEELGKNYLGEIAELTAGILGLISSTCGFSYPIKFGKFDNLSYKPWNLLLCAHLITLIMRRMKKRDFKEEF
jgi:hypothetical protein